MKQLYAIYKPLDFARRVLGARKMQDLILVKDINYFGRTIKRGSTFKKDDSDWYVLWENNNGIIMHCPAIQLHFTSVNSDYFVIQYE